MSVMPDYTKLTGITHLLAGTRYSAAGAKRAWKEAAVRHEVFAFGLLMAAYLALGVSLTILCAAIILFLALVSAEALNTAVEEIIDRISPEISTTGRHAKDLGSFAVFCLLTANAVLFLYALVTHLFL
ncbi:diacylglycerol kinase [Agrobacterium sp. AGB01]|uniref:diacylglycerol kinase n=1 Tax=Agrobacterium sp. AGB01 TaxID=2769302 RepID=UPI00177C9F29|nr:diacylglycerol kinase [Agrobacterium sp. AGB01]MBD9388196.1 diacylglycerol kinase [Agrobacterium sp. AGB01]